MKRVEDVAPDWCGSWTNEPYKTYQLPLPQTADHPRRERSGGVSCPPYVSAMLEDEDNDIIHVVLFRGDGWQCRDFRSRKIDDWLYADDPRVPVSWRPVIQRVLDAVAERFPHALVRFRPDTDPVPVHGVFPWLQVEKEKVAEPPRGANR